MTLVQLVSQAGACDGWAAGWGGGGGEGSQPRRRARGGRDGEVYTLGRGDEGQPGHGEHSDLSACDRTRVSLQLQWGLSVWNAAVRSPHAPCSRGPAVAALGGGAGAAARSCRRNGRARSREGGIRGGAGAEAGRVHVAAGTEESLGPGEKTAAALRDDERTEG